MNLSKCDTPISLAANLSDETFPWDDPESKQTRRTIYYILHGILGLFVASFNGVILAAVYKRPKLRQKISLVMVNMFAFCFLHGIIFGLVYPLQRVYRYQMSAGVCVASTLLTDFCDKYILVLLPVLAMERLISLKYPSLPQRKFKLWSIISMVLVVVITVCIAWLPLAPQLNIPQGKMINSNCPRKQREINNFYKYYSCQGLINKKNFLEPYIAMALEVCCVLTVILIYLWMYFTLKLRLSSFKVETKRDRLRRAACLVLVLAFTFIVTFLPYGVILQIRTLCDSNVSMRPNSFCNSITLELRFVFSLLSHLGNLLAPLIFILLSASIKRSLTSFLKCQEESDDCDQNAKNSIHHVFSQLSIVQAV